MVGLKIKVGRGSDKGRVNFIYPNLDAIDPEIRQGLNWASYCNSIGIGLHYDNANLIAKGNAQQYIYTAVPEAFANAAVAVAPNEVEIITEAELETAYNTVCHGNDPESLVDLPTVQAIYYQARLEEMGMAKAPSKAETDRRKRCLDPDDPSAVGIVKNPVKTYQGLKAVRKLT